MSMEWWCGVVCVCVLGGGIKSKSMYVHTASALAVADWYTTDCLGVTWWESALLYV